MMNKLLYKTGNGKMIFKKSVKTTLFYILLIGLVVIFFFPILWVILTSLKTDGEIYAWPPVFFPKNPTLTNYITVLVKSDLGRYFINSIIVSSLSTIFVVFFGSLASYALGRIRFKGSMAVMIFFIALSMFPQLSIVSTLFIWFRKLNLINNYLGLVLAYMGLFLPMSIWILTTYFKTIPMDIEESARIDGCSSFRILWQIIFPLSIPGVITSSLIIFIFTWNEFFLALVLLSKNVLRTATVGIALYPGEYAFPWGVITTATFLAILPLIILTLIFQKRIIGGLTAGAVKS